MTAPDPLAGARAALFLDRSCPLCGAGFSKPCRSSSGKTRGQVHAARKAAPAPVSRSWVQDGLFSPGTMP